MLREMTSWRLVVITLVVTCIGIAPTFHLLWPWWWDSFTYSHGLLVVPLCIWLLWKQRAYINAEAAGRSLLAGIPLLGLLFAWTLAFASSIEIGATASMPLILLCAVWFAAGFRVALITAFPILLLYSVIPVWDFINGFLQSMTTAAVTEILALLNVPAYIVGNTVQIPSGWFEIAGGCSGLHFFIVGLTLAGVYGHEYLHTRKNQIILLVVAGVMSVVMNWVRVATIITAGHLTDMQSFLVKVDHYYFGWALFAVMLFPFFLFARWLERREDGTERPAAGECRHAAVPVAAIGLVAVVALLPALVWGRMAMQGPSPVAIELPEIAGWQGPAPYAGNWHPRFRGPDGEAQASYLQDGQTVDVYVNWYRSQSQRRELIGFGNSVEGEQTRREYDKKYVDAAGGNASKLPEIREIMTSSRSGKQRLIWYYYLVGDRPETGRLEAKLRQGLRSLVGEYSTGLVSVSVACDTGDTDCTNARQVLIEQFASLDGTIIDTLIAVDAAGHGRKHDVE